MVKTNVVCLKYTLEVIKRTMSWDSTNVTSFTYNWLSLAFECR
jgi:hypothetical protein